MHKLFTSIVAVLLCLAAHAESVRFGSLSLEWPDGFTVKSTQVPFELSGPGGQTVLVTIMRLGKAANAEAEAVDVPKLLAMNERFLNAQAKKAGNVVVPMATETLPDGSTLQFTASTTGGLFRQGYFLQYIITSSSGRIGFLTFEGSGDPVAENQKARPIFQTARWEP